MHSKITLIVCLFALAIAAAAPASAQCSTDPNWLITEVRALRHAVEALATTGLRIQIVFGRLQLQEQRTNTAAQRLDSVRETLNDISQTLGARTEELKQLEETARSTRDAQHQESAMSLARETKLYISRLEAERARVAVEESDAAGRLAFEQVRWSELNGILDELERTLVKRPR